MNNQTTKQKSDLEPFEHGEEGTHFACQEMIKKHQGKTQCCGCTGHKCKQPKAEEKETWEDRFDVEFKTFFDNVGRPTRASYSGWNDKDVKNFIKNLLSTQKEQMIQRMNKIDQYSKVSTASGKKELLAKSDVLKALRRDK